MDKPRPLWAGWLTYVKIAWVVLAVVTFFGGVFIDDYFFYWNMHPFLLAFLWAGIICCIIKIVASVLAFAGGFLMLLLESLVDPGAVLRRGGCYRPTSPSRQYRPSQPVARTSAPPAPRIPDSEVVRTYGGGFTGLNEWSGLKDSEWSLKVSDTSEISDSDLKDLSAAGYSPLDKLGRAGAASMFVSPATLNASNRAADEQEAEEMRASRPSGMAAHQRTTPYAALRPGDPDIQKGPWYHVPFSRCHLLARSLGGTVQPENLVAGTPWMNDAMARTEREVAHFVENTGSTVFYRATPVFQGRDRVARGVRIEARSVDGGDFVRDVWCPNRSRFFDIRFDTGECTDMAEPLPAA